MPTAAPAAVKTPSVNYTGVAAGAIIGGYKASKMPAGKGQAQAIGGLVAGTAIALTGAAAAASAAVGVAAGAAAGALAGSVVPIIGTIIGAAAGALIAGHGGGKITQKHGRFSVEGHTACMKALIKREHWDEGDMEETYFVETAKQSPPVWKNTGKPMTKKQYRTHLRDTHGPQERWEPFTVAIPDGTTATFGRPSGLAPGSKKGAKSAGESLYGGGGSVVVVVVGLAAVAALFLFVL